MLSRLGVQLVLLGTLLAWLIELADDSDPYRFSDLKTSCVAVLSTVTGRRRADSFDVSSSCNVCSLTSSARVHSMLDRLITGRQQDLQLTARQHYCTNTDSEAVRTGV